ncbi:MAG: hypothetical protein SFX73_01755 [Kofleriaceae bacterium]|nr:hypothetical protein [Kofleriaceae bacterium]
MTRLALGLMLTSLFLCARATESSAVADEACPWHAVPSEQVLDVPMAGGRLVVEQQVGERHGSGYICRRVTAHVTHDRRTTQTVLMQGVVDCVEVRTHRARIEVEECLYARSHDRLVTTWRLDAGSGRLVKAGARYRNPYEDGARSIVTDLYAGRGDVARAALETLGDSPDGQSDVCWWWDAHRFLAAWPEIQRNAAHDPDAARALLVPYALSFLARCGARDGTTAYLASNHDLRVIPDCTVGDEDPCTVNVPAAALDEPFHRAVVLLRGGGTLDWILADILVEAANAGIAP